MKPRIRMYLKLWVCKHPGTRNGYGYDPKSAYDEWLSVNDYNDSGDCQ